MKVLHTSDWHLGKRLFKSERLPEQELFLNWILQTIQQQKIDVLIVAGDIFDVPSPPNLALQIFYNFIFKLKEIENLTTIIIGGNHDSAALLQIPEHFFAEQNCFIRSGHQQAPSKTDIIVTKDGKSYGFKTLPYFRNFELLNALDKENEESTDRIESYFNNYFSSWDHSNSPDFKFLIAHHVFGNYEMSGSEHAIHLSGLDHFPLSWVSNKFDYVALGHIHKKMVLSETPPIIYPGSPIPMRFSESGKKKVSFITCSGDNLSYEFIDIPVFRNLIKLTLTLENYEEEILKVIKTEKEKDIKTFLEVIIELESPEQGLADKIRALLEKSNLELLSYIPVTKTSKDLKKKSEVIGNLSIEELFGRYFTQKFPNSPIPQEISNSFRDLLESINHEDS